MLQDTNRVANPGDPTKKETEKIHADLSEAVKAVLLISGADKQRCGKLKDDLADSYLLGSNQYPDTFNKALCVLGNYQAPKNALPFRGSPSSGVAFIQRRHKTGRGAGQGKGAGHGGSGSNASFRAADMPSSSGSTAKDAIRINSKGESHCYNCGEGGHWAHSCPHLSNKQQQQLHMMEEGHQLMHVMLAQRAALPNNRAYLDGCSTVMAFKLKKYLKEVQEQDSGIKINCNAGAVVTNLMQKYGSVNAWYIPSEGMANIFSMHKLEKKHRITYNSWQGYYKVYMPSRPVSFTRMSKGCGTSTLMDWGKRRP